MTQAICFGLCDDGPNLPAYVDTTEDAKWIAIVKNDDRYEVTFTAIDNCIEIRRADGMMDKRCDGMLTYENNLIFIELKERNVQNRLWIAEGEAQLKNIITLFKANHDITIYNSVKAYVANRLRPRFQDTQMLRMQKFKDETGVILEVRQEIKL